MKLCCRSPSQMYDFIENGLIGYYIYVRLYVPFLFFSIQPHGFFYKFECLHTQTPCILNVHCFSWRLFHAIYVFTLDQKRFAWPKMYFDELRSSK